MNGYHPRMQYNAPALTAELTRLDGRVLVQADSGFEIDNMEGIAVHRGAGGDTIVSLISDDNFNALLQRTVFLQFTLVGSETGNILRP